MKSKNNIKTYQLIVGDILLIIFVIILTLMTYFINLYLFSSLHNLIQIFTVFLSFYFSLCIIAILIPKVPPGLYHTKEKAMVKWFIGLIFGRIWHFPLIMYPIFNSVILRTIFLKCMGQKISLKSAISSDLSIYDPHLVEIGDNVVIGVKTTIVPHYITGEKLYLGKVSIGSGSLVGAGTEIAAGSTIGKNVRIDLKCLLMPDSVLPDNTCLKSHSIISKKDLFKEGEIIPPYYRSVL